MQDHQVPTTYHVCNTITDYTVNKYVERGVAECGVVENNFGAHPRTKYAGELHNVATGTTENSTAAAVGK